MVLLHHVPFIVPMLYPGMLWNKDRGEKSIYLTFDDGPVLGVTEFVLEELGKRGQKATFFMVGDNVKKNPSLAKEVFKAGHQIGNHTFHHLNGFRCSVSDYLESISACDTILKETLGAESNLFRPPYGRITKKQQKILQDRYQIVMWDVLSGDYDPGQPVQKCLDKTIKYSRNGSIVLFHDQEKTAQTIREVLPPYLDHIQAQGFQTGLL
ncbi:polysaccharide deacetylase family protein [Mongoliibacter ruber]|uniref:Peptidoglycan/xylan/chitin deacetylase (PgdA/CDA1 family) n=1 Tax=Mongoliibacter ruber TaxID=1750599 RepID=A0A2T0WLR7_9BACT|nr:polysaccharide deacetylase family protein [Mongoliibacter ruber]PRY87651.1 peptidoglycan/xylan/chitin deacetylase (PgdA/CDA1 family) [Mongoliibacter ruber]